MVKPIGMTVPGRDYPQDTVQLKADYDTEFLVSTRRMKDDQPHSLDRGLRDYR